MRRKLHKLLAQCWRQIFNETEPPSFQVRIARAGFGEYSANIALVGAGISRRSPSQTAQMLKCCVQAGESWPGQVEELKGFLNFHLNDNQLSQALQRAVAEGARYGGGDALENTRVNVEFVSAEPTGPLTLGAGRIAACGEALCRLLEAQGANVTREFFLNDAETSSKMRLLGESVEFYYLDSFEHEAEQPEGVMTAPWVQRVAQEIIEREGNAYLLVPGAERVASFARQARDSAVAEQKTTLRQFGVHFDVWVSESALRREGRIENALSHLRERGYLDERDGAIWLRSTAFGDETDRSLVRANGEPTYLASDIAYHIFKFERGFDQLLNIWSAPHQTYVTRTHAALQAAGYATDTQLEVLTCADAHLLREGERATNRALGGRELTLEENLREVEAGVLRFLLVLQPWNEEVNIDLETARRDDEKNPGYAAQLLPSRLATMIGAAQESAASPDKEYSKAERSLARLVALWPDEAATAAERREPSRVARFVLEMAEATRELLRANEVPHPPLLRAAHITASNALRVLGMEVRDKF